MSTARPPGAIVRITYATWATVEPGDCLLTPTNRGYRILEAQLVRSAKPGRPRWKILAVVLGERKRWRRRPPARRTVHPLFWHPRDAIRARRKGAA